MKAQLVEFISVAGVKLFISCFHSEANETSRLSSLICLRIHIRQPSNLVVT